MLQKQSIDIAFTKGLDTGTDPKLVAKPTRLENAVFNTVGKSATISKRPGTVRLTSTSDDGSLSTADSIGLFRGELLSTVGSHWYSLTSGWNEWVQKPALGRPYIPSKQQIIHGNRTQYDFDQATANGITVFAWYEASSTSSFPGVHIAVMDEATGAFYVAGGATQSGSSASVQGFPRCIAVGTYLHVYFFGGNAADATHSSTLYLVTINTATPETLSAPIALRTDGYSTASTGSAAMDAIPYAGNTAMVVYGINSAGTAASYTLMQVSQAGVVSGSPAPATTSARSGAISSVAIQKETSGNVYVWWRDGTGCAYKVVSSSFASILATTVVGSTTVAGMVESSINFITLIGGSSTQCGALSYAVLTSAGVTTALTQFARDLQLQSVPFLMDGVVCVAAKRDLLWNGTNHTIEPTSYVLDLSGNVVARVLSGVTGGTVSGTSSIRLAQPLQTSSGVVAFLLPEQGQPAYTYPSAIPLSGISSSGPVSISPSGITRIALTSTKFSALPRVQIGRSLFIGGANPMVYDGTMVCEAGFHAAPDVISIGGTGAAGNMGTGTYQWRFVYAWTDHQGQVHRSLPSPPVSYTFNSGSTNSATLTLQNLLLSQRENSSLSSSTIIEVYRTSANGSIFYLESSVSAPTYNTTASNTQNFSSTISDTNLEFGELLYTTGGILDASPVPACSVAVAYKNRVFVAGLENPYEFRYSTQAVEGRAVRFNEVLNGYVPRTKGVITGLASMDDKLIVFCERGLWVIYGDGADETGANSTLTMPQDILVDVGCDAWQSIAPIPEGLMFHSAKGWHLLGRDLSVSYIGKEVEVYNGYTVRSALLLSDQKQVRWLIDQGSDVSNGLCLVYDYFYRTWSTFPSYGGLDAVMWGGKYTRVRSDGTFWQEAAAGTYSDNGSAPPSTLVETEWIKTAGIQGFQRVWRALLFGAWDGTTQYTLTVDIGYDYDTNYDTANDRYTITVNGTNFSVTGPVQTRHHLRKQKCEAIRFRIQDGSLSSPYNGLALTGLTLECGVKKGAYKLPAGQTT